MYYVIKKKFNFFFSCSDVAVDIIADFKKMRSLTVDRSLILKAIQNSSLVEVRMYVGGATVILGTIFGG